MFWRRLVAAVALGMLLAVTAAITSAPRMSGAMLGYASNEGRVWAVRLYDMRSRLDLAMPAGNYQPSTFDWSPDCEHVAFIHSSGRGGSVLVANWRTGKVTPLLDTLPEEGYSLPRYSPDGTRLLLVRYMTDGSGTDVVLLDVNTLDVTMLLEDVRGSVFPSWSPDGERVLFVGFANGQFDLFEYTLATGEAQPLTQDRGREIAPAYAPDGSRIAYTREVNGRSNIYALDTTTGEIEHLTTDFNDAISPTWSPDGAHIAYARGYNPFGDFNVFMLDLATRTERRLTSRSGWNVYPMWADCGG